MGRRGESAGHIWEVGNNNFSELTPKYKEALSTAGREVPSVPLSSAGYARASRFGGGGGLVKGQKVISEIWRALLF